MSTLAEIVPTAHPLHRVAVYYDEESSECPIEWLGSDEAGMLSVRHPNRSHGFSFGDWADSAQQSIEYADEYGQPDQTAEPYEAGLRHLHRAGYQADYFSLRGSSQGEWHDVLIWCRGDRGSLDSLAKVVNQWFSGEIYVLEHQTREHVECEHVEHWEGQDSIGGVYLTSATPEAVLTEAREYFEFPETQENQEQAS